MLLEMRDEGPGGEDFGGAAASPQPALDGVMAALQHAQDTGAPTDGLSIGLSRDPATEGFELTALASHMLLLSSATETGPRLGRLHLSFNSGFTSLSPSWRDALLVCLSREPPHAATSGTWCSLTCP